MMTTIALAIFSASNVLALSLFQVVQELVLLVKTTAMTSAPMNLMTCVSSGTEDCPLRYFLWAGARAIATAIASALEIFVVSYVVVSRPSQVVLELERQVLTIAMTSAVTKTVSWKSSGTKDPLLNVFLWGFVKGTATTTMTALEIFSASNVPALRLSQDVVGLANLVQTTAMTSAEAKLSTFVISVTMDLHPKFSH